MRHERSLRGTLLALFAGWATGIIVVSVLVLTGLGHVFEGEEPALERVIVWSAWMTALLSIVWLLGFVPVYFFVSRSSHVWRPGVCSVIGAVVGAFVVAALTGAPIHDAFCLYVAAALIGGITCLTGALLRHRFHGPTI